MDERKWKLLLIGMIIISLVAAGYAAWQRHTLESRNRSVDMAVVYDEAASLARMNGTGTVEVLSRYKENGVGAVLIKEPTVAEAVQNGELVARTGRELLALDDTGTLQALGDSFRTRVKPDRRYLIFTDRDIYQRVKGQLEAKRVQVNTWETPGRFIIEASYHWGLFDQLGLGIPAAAVEEINSAGLRVLVQLRTWNQVTPEGLHYVFGQLAGIPNLSGVLFNDPTLPGVPDQIRPLAYEIEKLGVPVVQIEFSDQRGLSRLGLLLDKHIVRLHTLSLEEDAKKNYSLPEIAARFTLAATERNIRILLFHTYTKADAPDMLETNMQLAGQVRDSLTAEGMPVGKASVLQPLNISRWLLLATGLGVIAGGMLLVMVMGWNRAAPVLGLLGLLLWAGLLAAGLVSPARKLMAFAAVVIFPTLSLCLNVRRGGSSVGRSVVLLLRTSLFSLAGALLMVGLLADVGYMLKLDQFTGVKLAHLVPLFLLAGIFFFRGDAGGDGWQRQLKRFLDQPVLVKFTAVGGVLLVALLVYVSRTGNESVAISPLELKFRTALDYLLGVRPRTKEFLLGHPLLMLLFYLGYRNNKYMPLLLMGAIGQISLVNTYAHIHTPLVVSLVRSFNGLWIGILGGLLLIGVWKLGDRLIKRYYVIE